MTIKLDILVDVCPHIFRIGIPIEHGLMGGLQTTRGRKDRRRDVANKPYIVIINVIIIRTL